MKKTTKNNKKKSTDKLNIAYPFPRVCIYSLRLTILFKLFYFDKCYSGGPSGLMDKASYFEYSEEIRSLRVGVPSGSLS